MWRNVLPACFSIAFVGAGLLACVGDDPAPVSPSTTGDGGTTPGTGTATNEAGTTAKDTSSFIGTWTAPAAIQSSTGCTEKSLESKGSAPVTYTVGTGSGGADLSISNSIAAGCVLLANIDPGGVTASLISGQTCTFSATDPDGVTVQLLYQYAATSHFSLQSNHTSGAVHIDAKWTISGGEYNGEGCTVFVEDDALTKQ